MYLCLYQDYLFFITTTSKINPGAYTNNVSVHFLKISNYLNIEKNNFFLISNDISVNSFNNLNIFTDSCKNIFEKKLYNYSCYLFELYNYNFQKIQQSTGLYIYLIMFLLPTFLKFFFRKKVFFFF